jgi:predicted CXXCH cytochrome family protein
LIKKNLWIIGGILVLCLFITPQIVNAQSGDNPVVNDQVCLSCHTTSNMMTELPSGESLYITIDPDQYGETAHGQLGYQCVQCHSDISEYPHRPNGAESLRDYSLMMYDLCGECHQPMYDRTLDSTHQKALAGGNENGALCTDCHDPHYMNPPGDPRSNTAAMCQQCHSEIYLQYQESVHGGDLFEQGDPNVPICIDCHGVHNTTGPSLESNFHLESPFLCGECHADEDLMDQYQVSTQVFDTYISDFHGTTVLLFDKTTPDQQTNKPVCVDLGGRRIIKKVDDPESQVMKENLLDTCQKCHPDATENFPTSWLNHYQPTIDKHPLVYYVNLFYKILIPVAIGGMIVFIASDIKKRISIKLEQQNE